MSGTSRVWLNDGSGAFTEFPLTGITSVSHLNIVDIDGDGNQDILLSRVGGSSLVGFFNDGAMNFTQRTLYASSGALYESQVGDIDGDGFNDIYVTEQQSGGRSNLLLINDGSDNFIVNNIASDTAASITVRVIDIDNDGDLDIYRPSYNASQNTLWINDGLGNGGASFSASNITGDTGSVYQTQVIDIDNDGDLDIYNVVAPGQNTLWINDGLGNGGASFSASNITGDTDSGASAIIDVNADGYLDIYSSLYGAQSYLWINDGLGNGGASFANDAIPGNSPSTVFATSGDFDGDGITDLYVGVYAGGQNLLLINDFEPPEPPSSSSRSSSGGIGSIRYVCKDKTASNYNGTRFARHKQSKCKFDTDIQDINTSIGNVCTIPFDDYYQKGDSHDNVAVIQSFLNSHLNIDLFIDGIFGNQTHDAVSQFQDMYKTDILVPWGLSSPTGRWYQSTRKKANDILGCSEGMVTLDNGVILK